MAIWCGGIYPLCQCVTRFFLTIKRHGAQKLKINLVLNYLGVIVIYMKHDYLQETADIYTRAAIGEHTHVPLNMIFQGTGEPDKVAGVFQFQADPKLIKALTGGGDVHSSHVLLIGDAFIRSKIICETKALQGYGISGIYTTGFSDLDKWVKQGKILKENFNYGIRDKKDFWRKRS